ncbi:metallophosphoesterase family protein [Clostridium tagluense]|uniref:Serine/threonine protein phosphatase n=1 Tax=Clostridium tagluense TaxID=360422 RepID=A0A401UNU2_9CLOT|nr:metallophosphoesterase family protein [Clostridium tagluense]GCD11181.1 serine/threonine protein phosphatase [Clostridium tagluense]
MIKVKVLLVSDIEDSYISDHFDYERFSEIELVISCGDLKADYLEYIANMIKAPLLYVNGNHDVNYLKTPPAGCISIDGKIFVYKNLRILGLGGSIDYNSGPFQYSQKEMSKRASKLKLSLWKNKGFDILVTHSPAKGIWDAKDPCHQGFEVFIDILNKYSPKYFFYGHQHLDYAKGERKMIYNTTTLINAFKYHIVEI